MGLMMPAATLTVYAVVDGSKDESDDYEVAGHDGASPLAGIQHGWWSFATSHTVSKSGRN